MWKISARLAALSAATLLMAGCSQTTSMPQAQTDTQVANFQLVSDIPIPANASLDSDRSLILSDRDHWTGRVVMRIWQHQPELTAFYQTQMPAFGWEPVMSVTSTVSVLSYVRGERAATVQLERSAFNLYTTVSVTVAPRQSANPQPLAAGGAGAGATPQTAAPPPPPPAVSRPQVRAE